MSSLDQVFTQAWYRGAVWLWLFWPLALIYRLVVSIRRALYRRGISKVTKSDVPVVVVGNITLGGAGKSPLVSYLVESFKAKGYRPGVVSRGYGAQTPITDPILLTKAHSAEQAGDEPLMLFRMLNVPVAVCPKRSLAVAKLVESGCDIVIADDGLQHYAMGRDLEICVFDGQRMWGNGQLIPAGPLREPLSRLDSVDYIVTNGAVISGADLDGKLNGKPRTAKRPGDGGRYQMSLIPKPFREVFSGEELGLESLQSDCLVAFAGIGNPERFFGALEAQGLTIERQAKPDHHQYSAEDFVPFAGRTVIMTEKDAVKCRALNLEHLNLRQLCYLPVKAELDHDLAATILSTLVQRGRLAAL